MQNQTADVTWRPGSVPVSRQFDDPYFSLEDGVAETRHVFLSGNDLPARFKDGFHIAELGFGTGLNFLTTLQAWSDAHVDGTLYFTSFEAYPMQTADMKAALAAFPDLAPLAGQLVAQWSTGGGVMRFGETAQLSVIIDDARSAVPAWESKADAWFLDGFSPAKNPELWNEALMQDVAEHTLPGGTCATYTAAGFVRRGLQAAGFEVSRVPGYGRKRHMTRGVLRG